MKNIKVGKNHGTNLVSSNGKTVQVKKVLVTEIEKVLEKNIDQCANGKNKRVGHLTIEKRESQIFGFVADMYALDFCIESMLNIREKHVRAWVEFLVNNEQMPSTIQNKLSFLRVYCNWIGKPGFVRSPEFYVEDSSLVKRTTATKHDKSWDSLDKQKLLDVITLKDKYIGMQNRLCDEFGLRRVESIMFKPHVDDEGDYLYVHSGTKGSRPRIVPVVNAVQRALLEEAKQLADPKTGLIAPPGKTLKQAINRFKYVMKYCGLTKKSVGVTAHGLRHGYVHKRYEDRTGGKLPVKGGKPGDVDPTLDKIAKLKTMEEVGHSRVSVGTAYGGSFGHAGRANHRHEITEEELGIAICESLESLKKCTSVRLN
jgi:integrase